MTSGSFDLETNSLCHDFRVDASKSTYVTWDGDDTIAAINAF